MDAEHRHELKENDLAQFITNFGQWWSKHGLSTSIVLLVVLAGFAGWQITGAMRQRRHEQVWSQLTTTSSPDVLRRLAGEFSDPTARALANLWGAARYNLQVSLPGAQDATTTAEAGFEGLDHADRMLAGVLEDPQVPELIKLNAMLTQAAVQENRRDFDAAGRIYEKIEQRVGPGYESFRQRAGRRRKLLEKLRVPVVYGPEPVAKVDEVLEGLDGFPTLTPQEEPVVAPVENGPTSAPATP